MGNVYEGGDADKRQEGDIVPKMFRQRYRKLEDHEIALHDAIKDKAEELAALFAKVDKTPRGEVPHAWADIVGHVAMNRGAHVTLALRHLEDAVYRAVKALTA